MLRLRTDESPRGQVLVLSAIGLTIMLAFAALAIDVGRQMTQRRYLQNAADAAALAGCNALISGSLDSAAAEAAREIATLNSTASPAGATTVIPAATSRVYADGNAGDPAYLVDGFIVSGTTVRVALRSSVPTVLAGLVGIDTLGVGAQARCELEGEPKLPLVARRYANPPGPGHAFVDHLATAATSGSGSVDQTNVVGYDNGARMPASRTEPGPMFALYGPDARAGNDSSFRGFIALDIRNFASLSSRVYYNGVTPGMSPNAIKGLQATYFSTGYPGPAFPPITTPSDPNDQVAVLRGNDSAQVVGSFDDVHATGDEVLIALYNGTVMKIPDFSITPPQTIDVPSTGTVAIGPSFAVGRNREFNSSVTLYLRGDAAAATASAPHPEYVLLSEPPAAGSPAAGKMSMPVWTTNVFIPDIHGTTVGMRDIYTNAVAPGIYTVWLEGRSGDPYFQTRRSPVAVRVGGATRDFNLSNSTTYASVDTVGTAANLPILVSTTSGGATAWGTGGAVQLSVDVSSLPSGLSSAQVSLSAASVMPSASGSGALSTLSVDTSGLAAGAYSFNVRATGTNGAGQPVTHLLPVTVAVATHVGEGTYVDIIGFAIFRIGAIDSNSIHAQAVSGIYTDPNHPDLRRIQTPRLVPWQ